MAAQTCGADQWMESVVMGGEGGNGLLRGWHPNQE